VLYLGANDDVITGRSMDWKSDIATNLWIFPRGMERSGEAGPLDAFCRTMAQPQRHGLQ
jgi:choloylglycine hydrolase